MTAPTFDRLWGWTRANLMVRNDELVAWRFDPQRRPAVADMNNASDGDLLIAWALAEAADHWGDLPYRMAARRIAVELSRKVVLFKTKLGALLLPAVAGFNASDRADGPVVNLSYYVFPAFARLDSVAPEVDWAGLTQTGLDLLEATRHDAGIAARRLDRARRLAGAAGRRLRAGVRLQRRAHSALSRLGGRRRARPLRALRRLGDARQGGAADRRRVDRQGCGPVRRQRHRLDRRAGRLRRRRREDARRLRRSQSR